MMPTITFGLDALIVTGFVSCGSFFIMGAYAQHRLYAPHTHTPPPAKDVNEAARRIGAWFSDKKPVLLDDETIALTQGAKLRAIRDNNILRFSLTLGKYVVVSWNYHTRDAFGVAWEAHTELIEETVLGVLRLYIAELEIAEETEREAAEARQLALAAEIEASLQDREPGQLVVPRRGKVGELTQPD